MSGQEEVSSKIIAKWREMDEGVIHVRHSSTNAESKLQQSSSGFNFNPLCKPIEGEDYLN